MALFNPNQRRPATPPATRTAGRQFSTLDPERQREVEDAPAEDRSTGGQSTPAAGRRASWAVPRGRRGGEESTAEPEDATAPAARTR